MQTKAALSLPKIPSRAAGYHCFKTPMGWVAFAVTRKGLRATAFMTTSNKHAMANLLESPALKNIKVFSLPEFIASQWKLAFQDCFKGTPMPIYRIPLDDSIWTPFQRRVYTELIKKVPRGKVVTYGGLASYICSSRHSRAVGQAMSANVMSPFVPCHRVVSSDLNLHAYSAAGGLAIKAALLISEGVTFSGDGTVQPCCCLAL